jgi:hypothetical protein
MLPRLSSPRFLSARVLLVAILYDVRCVSLSRIISGLLCVVSLRWLYNSRALGFWIFGTTWEEQVQVTAWRGLYNWLLRGSACPRRKGLDGSHCVVMFCVVYVEYGYC